MKIEMTTYLIAGSISNGPIYHCTDTSANYTSGTTTWSPGDTSKNWSCIASSADGGKLAAGIGPIPSGYIYTSMDSGSTWTERTGPGLHSWTGIASSGSGTILAACSGIIRFGDYIYTSTDSGVTWTQQTAAGLYNWTGITISSDGTKIAACAQNQYIVTGVYSGGSWTWTTQTNSANTYWKSITSSSNGNIIYACETNAIGSTGNIWKSTDSGVTWTNISPSINIWFGITTNGSGTKVATYTSSSNVGRIYVSINGGTSFSGPYSGLYRWKSISYSSDGSLLAACVDNTVPANGYIYVSADDGATFTTQTNATLANWSAITVSGPIGGVCFRGTTLVSMADRSLKAIKDIERGDEILTDRKTGITKKVARTLQFMATGKGTQIPIDLIGNTRTIVCTSNHPFWIGDSRRILAGDIEGTQKIQICELLYTIQFEEEGTYYVENAKVDAVSPDHRKHKLPKELYFDQMKYKESRIIKSEDDPRRNKPKMTKTL